MRIIDNGGAIAIKGFNYQTASIILVIIRNYDKDDFEVIPESKDDVEVRLNNTHYFIQIKGTKKLSIAKLIKKEKDKDKADKKSIIEKNLAQGDDNSFRKIFLCDMTESMEKDLVPIKEEDLINPLLQYSKDQKKEIATTLKLTPNLTKRLDKQYIYKTPFENNYQNALIYLTGYMVDRGLVGERSGIVLNELTNQILQKSEIVIKNEEEIELKSLKGSLLKQIFTKVEREEEYNNLLATLPYNHLMKKQILKKKTHIPILYTALKDKVKRRIDVDLLSSKTDYEAINSICEIIDYEDKSIDTNLKIALSIDCYIELGDDQVDYQ